MQSKIDEELRHTLEGQVEKLSEDVLELQQRARDAEASQQEMAEEHEHAMHDMQLATSEGRKACEELADAQASASKAGADCVRAQQVGNTRPSASLAAPHVGCAADLFPLTVVWSSCGRVGLSTQCSGVHTHCHAARRHAGHGQALGG